MLSQQQIIALYELLYGKNVSPSTPPTPKSIAAINEALRITLPASFIAFAKACTHYGAVLASIGEDYGSGYHILNLNKSLHHESPNESRGLPPWAIIINHGHDGDCDCLDTRHFDEATGEYRVMYCEVFVWEFEPPDAIVHESNAEKTFPAYLESLVLSRAERHFDNRNRSGQLRSESRDIVPKIEAILEGRW